MRNDGDILQAVHLCESALGAVVRKYRSGLLLEHLHPALEDLFGIVLALFEAASIDVTYAVDPRWLRVDIVDMPLRTDAPPGDAL